MASSTVNLLKGIRHIKRPSSKTNINFIFRKQSIDSSTKLNHEQKQTADKTPVFRTKNNSLNHEFF